MVNKKRVIALVEQIAKPFESCRLKAYWDCAGYPTNGWGNLLSRIRLQDVMKKNNWTKAQADQWLQETYPPISQEEADYKLEANIEKAYRCVSKLVKVALKEEQLAALTDFAFNAGGGNLQISTLLRKVNRNDLIEAADEFLKWNKAGGIVQRGLTRRCLSRRKLFLVGLQ